MSYILRRNNWGEESTKWVLEGLVAAFKALEKPLDCKIINKDEQPIPHDDWCIRWATTSSVFGNPKVINRAEAIHRVYNKGVFRKTLSDAGMAPKTVIDQYPTNDMYPVVIRPMNHGRSDDLYIAHDLKAAKEAISQIKKEHESFYCSHFVDKDKEFRVFVVSGRVVAVCEKIPDDKDNVSWGCVGDGKFQYIKWSQWPIPVIKVACESFDLSGLDFGAVDVILKDQAAYVLEINTGPDVGEYYGYQLGIGLSHILDTGSRDKIPIGNKPNNPYSYAHPAMTNSAILKEAS